jgi:hypothetical protein
MIEPAGPTGRGHPASQSRLRRRRRRSRRGRSFGFRGWLGTGRSRLGSTAAAHRLAARLTAVRLAAAPVPTTAPSAEQTATAATAAATSGEQAAAATTTSSTAYTAIASTRKQAAAAVARDRSAATRIAAAHATAATVAAVTGKRLVVAPVKGNGYHREKHGDAEDQRSIHPRTLHFQVPILLGSEPTCAAIRLFPPYDDGQQRRAIPGQDRTYSKISRATRRPVAKASRTGKTLPSAQPRPDKLSSKPPLSSVNCARCGYWIRRVVSEPWLVRTNYCRSQFDDLTVRKVNHRSTH